MKRTKNISAKKRATVKTFAKKNAANKNANAAKNAATAAATVGATLATAATVATNVATKPVTKRQAEKMAKEEEVMQQRRQVESLVEPPITATKRGRGRPKGASIRGEGWRGSPFLTDPERPVMPALRAKLEGAVLVLRVVTDEIFAKEVAIASEAKAKAEGKRRPGRPRKTDPISITMGAHLPKGAKFIELQEYLIPPGGRRRSAPTVDKLHRSDMERTRQLANAADCHHYRLLDDSWQVVGFFSSHIALFTTGIRLTYPAYEWGTRRFFRLRWGGHYYSPWSPVFAVNLAIPNIPTAAEAQNLSPVE